MRNKPLNLDKARRAPRPQTVRQRVADRQEAWRRATAHRPQARVTFYAQLAGVASLRNATGTVRKRLLAALQPTGFECVYGENRAGQWAVLQRIHPTVRKTLRGLLADEAVSLHGLAARECATIRLTPGNYLQEEYGAEFLYQEPLIELYRLLKTPSFPFCTCPWCNHIFVPNRNQKYCKTACTQAANEAKRRNNPARREKLREYNRRSYTKRTRQGET